MQRAKETIIASQREALDAAEQREDLERGIEERRESEAKSRADIAAGRIAAIGSAPDLEAALALKRERLAAAQDRDRTGPAVQDVVHESGEMGLRFEEPDGGGGFHVRGPFRSIKLVY